MGPRPCGRGRVQAAVAVDVLVHVLQWGHGLAAVDGDAGREGAVAGTGFNGATALRPWTVGTAR